MGHALPRAHRARSAAARAHAPCRIRRARRCGRRGSDHVARHARRACGPDPQGASELLSADDHRDDGRAVRGTPGTGARSAGTGRRRPAPGRMNPQLDGIERIPGTYVFDLKTSVRTLRINRFFWRMTDPAHRERFRADEESLYESGGLSEEERALIRRRDWLGLVRY